MCTGEARNLRPWAHSLLLRSRMSMGRLRTGSARPSQGQEVPPRHTNKEATSLRARTSPCRSRTASRGSSKRRGWMPTGPGRCPLPARMGPRPWCTGDGATQHWQRTILTAALTVLILAVGLAALVLIKMGRRRSTVSRRTPSSPGAGEAWMTCESATTKSSTAGCLTSMSLVSRYCSIAVKTGTMQ